MEKTRDQDPNPHNNRCGSETLPVPVYRHTTISSLAEGYITQLKEFCRCQKKICNPGSEIFQTVDAVGEKLRREKRKEEKKTA